MSECDNTESQCESNRQRNGVEMGDVLAKKQSEDGSQDENTDSEAEARAWNADEDVAVSPGAVSSDSSDDQKAPSSVEDVENGDSAKEVIQRDKNTEKDDSSFSEDKSVDLKRARCNNLSTVPAKQNEHLVNSCECKSCQLKRKLLALETGKSITLQCLWEDVRNYVRSVFDIAMDAYCNPNYSLQFSPSHMANMCNNVFHLSKKDPHTLLMKLVGQAQEFVVEVKVRLLILLHDRNVNNLAEIFLTALLDGYDAIISTAMHVSKMIEFLKKERLCKLNIKWESFNKKLYQNYVYTDPLVQNNLPPFIGQLRKLLPRKGVEYQGLVHRYLAFDDEMTRISDTGHETEQLIEKYNIEQATQMEVYKKFREGYDLFKQRCAPQRTCKEAMNRERMMEKGEDCEEKKQLFSDKYETVRLLDGWNKTRNQRLPTIVEKIIAYDNKPAYIEQGIGPPYCNDPEFWFGYESALVFTYFCTCEKSLRQNKQGCRARAFSKSSSEGPKLELTNGDRVSFTGANPDIGMTNSIEPTKCNKTLETNGDLSKYYNSANSKSCSEPKIICQSNGTEEENSHVVSQQSKSTSKDEPQKMKTRENKSTEVADVRNIEPCPCVYHHAKEIIERKKPVVTENPPCACLLDTRRKWDSCACLKKTGLTEPSITNGHSDLQQMSARIAQESSKSMAKSSSNSTNSAQTPQTRHSTTQTPNTTNNHAISPHQGPHVHNHGSSSEANKAPNSAHRIYGHNNHPITCHKQHTVEHIKRLSNNDLSSGDGDCSDSGSSQEDSCSTSSSTPRDASRHCDCCYCEVFGHGVPSVAPVSRNYNEMRERLRQLLTKKRAKKCKAECSPPKSPAESLPSNTISDSKTVSSQSGPRSNTPMSTASTLPRDSKDERDLDALLEFIEGGQTGKKDDKKAEKKARQKQRKLDEKIKKDRREEERRKLIEIQKKTPEVTITVVDPQKPVSQRVAPQRKLPEVSILPAVIVPSIPKQPVNTTKEKQKTKTQAASSNVHVNVNQSKSAGKKGKGANNVDRVDGIVSSSQATKGTKADKTEVKGSNKQQQQAATAKVKTNVVNVVKPLAKIDPNDPNLTKKERKKLRRELRKQEEANAAKEPEKQTQIVTIKRVMESNCAEPTVTITLKGQTPAEDKVLFTLVNGQTKEPELQSGKKKKKKGKNNANVSQPQQSQPQSNNMKQKQQQQQQQVQTKENKAQKQQPGKEKSKNNKTQVEEAKFQKQQHANESKSTKSKKENKNTENKENVAQQQTANKGKNQQQNQQNQQLNKKQNKNNVIVQQVPLNQKKQEVKVQESNGKKSKAQQQKQQQQPQQVKVILPNQGKNAKNAPNIKNVNSSIRIDQKSQPKPIPIVMKQRPVLETKNIACDRIHAPLSSQFKNLPPNVKIDIENLKLPPGITITKVDTPAKPIPIKSAPMPRPNTAPKQTAIIAAPMNGMSNYGSSQSGGNVIVVDTGKLKQELMPKPGEKADLTKEPQQSQQTAGGKKKKKKKNKQQSTSAASAASQSNDCHMDRVDSSARIVHNPATNMVTIRNPAFGPPKMEPSTQQAAIIKVSENGMVTIRSPALQQAINAGLTPPPKPDFIVKGDLPNCPSKTNTGPSANQKRPNGIVPSSLADFHSRLNPDCTGLSGLANIQISKVANGHPIPENGINLKGTSVTLTKVKSETSMSEMQQAKCAVREAINATMAASSNGKGKKKKKRGNGARPCGDDWNLVESVFTPKDIDLEDGEMDDAERELEAFKRFCLQSVPPPRKEKVNLNIKDIVLKKKSSAAAAAAVIAAN